MYSSRTRSMVILSLVFLFLAATPFYGLNLRAQGQAQESILIARLNGQIDLAAETYLSNAIQSAGSIDARLMVILLSTPGGTVTSVKNVMSLIDESSVPIAVFIYPTGAVAWSGGTYMLMASHIAVMASASTIGSCQPVSETGAPIEDTKYVNSLLGLMTNHARQRNRNTTAAQRFITENLNLGASQALGNNVIEFIANDISSFLTALESYTLIKEELGNETVTRLVLSNDPIIESVDEYWDFSNIATSEQVEYSIDIQYIILHTLTNPYVASMLLLLGFYGMVFSLATPGWGGEIISAVLLILGVVGYGIIGVNVGAILLFILSLVCVFFGMKKGHESFFVPAGIVATLGSFLLLPGSSWLVYFVQFRNWQLFAVVISIGVTSVFAGLMYKARQVRNLPPLHNIKNLIGMEGMVKKMLDPIGQVLVLGEVWSATTNKPPIAEDTRVKIIGVERLTLIVEEAIKSDI